MTSATISLLLLLLQALECVQSISGPVSLLKEDLPAGTRLRQLRPLLQSRGITGQHYVLEQNHYFRFESGDLVLNRSLDRDSMCRLHEMCCQPTRVCNLNLEFVNLKFHNTVKVQLQLEDLNDHAPTFARKRIALQLVESTQVGHRTRIDLAHDPDSVPLGISRYSLTPNDGVFSLDQNRDQHGRIKDLFLQLDARLDRESQPRLAYNLTAIDGGDRQGHTAIAITVVDTNDHAPSFVSSDLEARVNEGERPGKCITEVKATDADEGANAQVSFLLDANQPNIDEVRATFEVRSHSGNLCLKRSLDYEQKQRHLVQIVAVNANAPVAAGFGQTATATVTVSVVNINDETPRIKVQTILDAVVENSVDKATVAILTVTDRDLGPTNGIVTCRLRPRGERNFSLVAEKRSDSRRRNKRKFFLVTRPEAPLDREAAVAFSRAAAFTSVAVVCSDAGKPQLEAVANVSVRILDQNDNAPQVKVNFRRSAGGIARIAENSRHRVVVATVAASDPDEGANGSVSLSMSQSPAETLRYFKLLPNGRIVNQLRLDREQLPPGADTFRVVVVATDQGQPPTSTSATFSIAVTDLNDNPPSLAQQALQFAVEENRPVGFHVGEIDVTDLDSVGSLSLRILRLRPSHSRTLPPFAIERRGGSSFSLVTSASLDSERMQLHKFLIVASDSVHSVTGTVTVSVIDVNDHKPRIIYPCDSRQRNHSVSWQEPPGHTVVRVSARDADQDKDTNGRLQFRLLSSGLFSIDQDTGEVKIGARMRSSDIGAKSVSVVVSDNGVPTELSSNCSFFILVDASQPRSRLAADARNGASARNGDGNGVMPLSDTGLLLMSATFVLLLLLLAALLLAIYARHWHQAPVCVPDLLQFCLQSGSAHQQQQQPKSRGHCVVDDIDAAEVFVKAEAAALHPGIYQTVEGSSRLRPPTAAAASLYDCGSVADYTQYRTNNRRQQQQQQQQQEQQQQQASVNKHVYQTLRHNGDSPVRAALAGCRSNATSAQAIAAAEEVGQRLLHKSEPDLQQQQKRQLLQQQHQHQQQNQQHQQLSYENFATCGQLRNPLRPFPSVQASYV